ncbi:MAG: hypothetical protein GX757_02705 [Clostridiales bacterium]|nr:hypothetical protein [Clostridiales bacterium]
MLLYKIMEVKPFMAKLLTTTAFDGYILKELQLQTFTGFTISGQLNEDFFSKEELEERNGITGVFWSEVRQIVYNMIKGSKTPLSLKVIFQLPPQQCLQILETLGGRLKPNDIGGLYLNIKFEKGELSVITGTAIKSFTMDKSLEHEWDEQVGRMLKDMGIAYS